MKRLAGCIDRGLAVVAKELPLLQQQVELVREVAATRDPAEGQSQTREACFVALRNRFEQSQDSAQKQMAQVMGSFQRGLFAGGDAADLPRDNLDLERWFRNPKGHERRIHGHRHAGVRIVLEGPTLVHVLDHHLRHPEPLTVAELLPYQSAKAPACQCEALARRALMRRARSTKQRPLLLTELEARYNECF